MASAVQDHDEKPHGDRLDDEARAALLEEEEVLRSTSASIEEQMQAKSGRFDRERRRARELTSSMVGTRRAEDRSQLVSDEAVSHALTAQHDDDLVQLEKQRSCPYFARIVLEEPEPSGQIRRIEYKLGQSANPGCRIVDWRRAPLSKLYYEYREGDEYCEEIQGREREGRIALRNRVDIHSGELRRVSCKHGTFVRTDSGWAPASGGGGSRDFSALPEVLSLISPEQFRAITQEAGNAVLIQGVAGSGKTTVALHRLSWLLDGENSDLTAADCLVLTLGPNLRDYVRSSLKALNLPALSVYSYREWSARQIGRLLPREILRGITGEPQLTPSSQRAPSSVERVKRSMGVLRAMEDAARRGAASPLDLLLATLSNPRAIREYDETKLIDEELIRGALARTKEMPSRGTLDRSDYSLILRAAQLLNDPVALLGRSGPFKHAVVDEIQDYSPVELATVLATVDATNNLTLVGDTSQRTEDGFVGWEKLRRWWSARKLQSTFIELEVSHRSTKQILGVASAISGRPQSKAGRSGPKPAWFYDAEQDHPLKESIEWLHKVCNAGPGALVGVLCPTSEGVREATKLLQPSFGSALRTGSEESLSFEEGILVCEVAAAKGLEFFGVLVWNPVSSNLPSGDLGRHLLYVAATRAQEYLAFATWGGSAPHLSAVDERLLQRVEAEVEEEEEREPREDEEE